MDNCKQKLKNIFFRFTAILLMIFSVLFGGSRNGQCIGDNIFRTLGLKAWSEGGTQGLHYVGVCSFAMLLIGIIIFSCTTKNKLQTFHYFMIGLTVIIIIGLL